MKNGNYREGESDFPLWMIGFTLFSIVASTALLTVCVKTTVFNKTNIYRVTAT